MMIIISPPIYPVTQEQLQGLCLCQWQDSAIMARIAGKQIADLSFLSILFWFGCR